MPTEAGRERNCRGRVCSVPSVSILGLNLLWTDGQTLAGSRVNRTLWTLERASPFASLICGNEHANPPDDASYRSVTLASERITDESWTPVPNGVVFSTDANAHLHIEPLDTAD